MTPFVRNDDALLHVALTGRYFGKRPSGLLGVGGEALALDLDLAAAYRLLTYDQKRDRDLVKALLDGLAMIVGGALGADMSGMIEDENDRFGDAQAEAW